MTDPRRRHFPDAVDDFFDNAPCGLLLTGPDGRITLANHTFAGWVGHPPQELAGRRFPDLLAAGSRIHYETHFAPLLQMTGSLTGITLDLIGEDGSRLPVFVTANVRTGADGAPVALRITVQDATERRSYERQLLEARRVADRERERVQLLAATLQRSLVPPSLTPPDGLVAAAHYHTASPDDVGGDFYDLFPLTRHKWGIFLGDVSGKGAGAAAVTSLTRYTLRAAAAYDDDPVTVLHNLDAVLSHEFHGDDPHFCTVLFGVIAPTADGFDVELASGGHPPALLMSASGQTRYVHTTGGQAVGILKKPRFVARTVHLGPGDTLVLYTDGLTEARTGPNRRFDDHDDFLDFARRESPTDAPTFVAAVQRLLDGFGAGLEDDTAVIAVSVPPPT
ncbi:SpoIIE family protein phosphatase [Mycobacterium sp. ITM-2016-00317]|uniref:PP2C family protein-serine/threonine phosphatase n=1 Tax=Mycobacterium sp. ITM-2016-00317 TaxID=2099694 RepID=UPI00287FEFF4|nr:SpoIIE family protein phosphatase [Mycobacterium sp. ITM-2016-00317]WNG89750.1 SpoIIE family protein phosphatase [Mycobacterium sp. ITM-2016-00317]